MQEEKLQKIREDFERNGLELSDKEFKDLVRHAKRKIEISNKDESYLLVLMPDVVKEYLFRKFITRISAKDFEGTNI